MFEIELCDAFNIANLHDPNIATKLALKEILDCNKITERFGLVLSEEQALELISTRNIALRDNSRIELGGGVINTIIEEFCDSPFISKFDYVDTISTLIETFYIFKNETYDLVSDEEIIKFMHKQFDGVCFGSIELLSGRELEKVSDNIQNGLRFDAEDDSIFEGIDENEW